MEREAALRSQGEPLSVLGTSEFLLDPSGLKMTLQALSGSPDPSVLRCQALIALRANSVVSNLPYSHVRDSQLLLVIAQVGHFAPSVSGHLRPQFPCCGLSLFSLYCFPLAGPSCLSPLCRAGLLGSSPLFGFHLS